MEELLRHLVFLARHFSDFGERRMIEVFLLEIGAPTGKSGFTYLIDAILIYKEAQWKSVTKVIYPEIAKKYQLDKKAVCKAIERVVQDAWKNRDEAWTKYFQSESRLTNAEFISRVAIIFDLWKACCESLSQKEGAQ